MELGIVRYKIQSILLLSLTRIQRYNAQNRFDNLFNKAELTCKQKTPRYDTCISSLQHSREETVFGNINDAVMF